MKINNISINNFKGIDSLKFEPKTINIIVGRNNTGKTSILESIACAFIPDFIEENFNAKPATLINYLSESAEIKFTASNGRNRAIKVNILKLKPEEIMIRQN